MFVCVVVGGVATRGRRSKVGKGCVLFETE